jgi:transposase-like protein
LKSNLNKIVRWFCSKLSYNELASAVVIFLEVLNGQRPNIKLKPDEDLPPHYRQFRVDQTLPLVEKPHSQKHIANWQDLQALHYKKHGKYISTVRRREKSQLPPPGCKCNHCGASAKYLYLNNGKLNNQLKCKICGKTSQTDKPRRESKARYWCPYCNYALSLWKEHGMYNAFKCPNDKCSFYLKNLKSLTPEEHQMREEGKYSQFKLRYLFREYHFASANMFPNRPKEAVVNLNRIHNNLNVVSLCLTFSINFGLSSRQTASVLENVFGIDISHQTVVNYCNSCASYLSSFIDLNTPLPTGTTAADETYLTVQGVTRYTWFVIDRTSRAICGYNLSETRGAEPAMALLQTCYGPPDITKYKGAEIVTDGLGSYDSAVVAYNTEASKTNKDACITKHTVIGLQNLNSESKEYRVYKQLVERLNRTYKYHTRPRAGFKTFDGAVSLTTLFVAYYNFMRPHSYLKGKPPVKLPCLKNKTLYQNMWMELLRQAA